MDNKYNWLWWWKEMLFMMLFVATAIQSLSHVRFFATLRTATCQVLLSFAMSWSLLKFMSTESVMLSNHLISATSFFCLQSCPASGSFSMILLFTSGGQSTGASATASVLPMNIQNWYPLVLTGLISLQPKGFSRVSSSTTILKHKFFQC